MSTYILKLGIEYFEAKPTLTAMWLHGPLRNPPYAARTLLFSVQCHEKSLNGGQHTMHRVVIETSAGALICANAAILTKTMRPCSGSP